MRRERLAGGHGAVLVVEVALEQRGRADVEIELLETAGAGALLTGLDLRPVGPGAALASAARCREPAVTHVGHAQRVDQVLVVS